MPLLRNNHASAKLGSRYNMPPLLTLKDTNDMYIYIYVNNKHIYTQIISLALQHIIYQA